MTKHYDHTQTGWLIIILLVITGIFTAGILFVSGLVEVAVATIVIDVIVLALFGSLRVQVDDEHLSARFGVGPIRKRIPLVNITAFGAVTNPWYYGWGIRLTPHGWLWNVSGSGAVEVRLTDGKGFRIGTDEPEALAKAIGRAVPQAEPLSEAQRAGNKKAQKVGAIVVATIIIVILALVGGMFYGFTRPPIVTVDAQSIQVDEFFYDTTIPTADVQKVELRDDLPNIEARTNGFAGAGSLRGEFRVTGMGEGRLFVYPEHPPFVVVTTDDSFVIMNQEDPGATKAIYDDIVGQTNR